MVDHVAELVQHEARDPAWPELRAHPGEVERHVEAGAADPGDPDGAGAGRPDVDVDEAVHQADEPLRLGPRAGDRRRGRPRDRPAPRSASKVRGACSTLAGSVRAPAADEPAPGIR